MNSFLVRRLAVFFICFISIELLAALYLAIDNFDSVDWTFKTIIQDLGVLQLTSFVSFLVMIFPYVVYLTLLPKKYQNNKYDKFITYAVFTIFTFLNITPTLILVNKPTIGYLLHTKINYCHIKKIKMVLKFSLVVNYLNGFYSNCDILRICKQ